MQDSLTGIIGGIVAICGCIVMARWMWLFSQQNSGQGRWLVWFAVALGVLSAISLLSRLVN
jgi:type IV secretory pathway VirB2 component (pilin)